jgi:hypothetical protein
MFTVNGASAYCRAFAIPGARLDRGKLDWAERRGRVEILARVDHRAPSYPVDLGNVLRNPAVLESGTVWLANYHGEFTLLKPIGNAAQINDFARLLDIKTDLIDLLKIAKKIQNIKIVENYGNHESEQLIATSALTLYQVLQIVWLTDGIQPLSLTLDLSILNQRAREPIEDLELFGTILACEGERRKSVTKIALCYNFFWVTPPFSAESFAQIRFLNRDIRKNSIWDTVFEIKKEAYL